MHIAFVALSHLYTALSATIFCLTYIFRVEPFRSANNFHLSSHGAFPPISHQKIHHQQLTYDSAEDPLQILSRYDIVFIVDDSASMRGLRWHEARSALANLVKKVAQYDDDGLDIYFLNNPKKGKGLNTEHAVNEFFDSVTPSGGTPLGSRVEQIAMKYLRRAEPVYREQPDKFNDYVKPVIYIVITDGKPTDDLHTVLVNIVKRLNRNEFPTSQVGIQFVQIGDDKEAKTFLEKLDNDIPKSNDETDIIDTTPYDGQSLSDEMLIKIMLGGINKKVDNLVLNRGG